ncbi:MAG: arylesterase [Gammaproteobacteria bacterium]|nr:arylesterase [Gammaproteobacteria bacterium]
MLRLTLLFLVLLNPLVAIAQSNTILVLGDSLSSGHGVRSGKGWVDLLQNKLNQINKNYTVINASISGDTTQGGLNRVQRSLNKHKPKIVILQLGANDGLRGLPLSNMKSNLQQIVEHCQKTGARVLVVGMQLPPNYGKHYTQQFANTFMEVAQESNSVLVPFLLEGFADNMSYFQSDGLHPKAKGQILMMQNVLSGLDKLL